MTKDKPRPRRLAPPAGPTKDGRRYGCGGKTKRK